MVGIWLRLLLVPVRRTEGKGGTGLKTPTDLLEAGESGLSAPAGFETRVILLAVKRWWTLPNAFTAPIFQLVNMMDQVYCITR